MTVTSKKADLGCGEEKGDSWFGVDIEETDAVDKVQDLDEEDWDLPSNHFEEVKAKDVFEHLDNPVNFLEEVHRIAKPDAEVWIKAPHLSSNNWTDPTHKRLAGFETVKKHFTEEGDFSYYSTANFREEEVRIIFEKNIIFPWNYIVEPLVNLNWITKNFFEKSFLSRVFPAQDVEFYLEVEKE